MSQFVNNINVIGVKGSEIVEQVKYELVKAFKMVDISPTSFYLGMKVDKYHLKKSFKLFQLAYINKILAKFNFN